MKESTCLYNFYSKRKTQSGCYLKQKTKDKNIIDREEIIDILKFIVFFWGIQITEYMKKYV